MLETSTLFASLCSLQVGEEHGMICTWTVLSLSNTELPVDACLIIMPGKGISVNIPNADTSEKWQSHSDLSVYL